MNKLELLLKETEFTQEENRAYNKVKLNYALQDLEEELNSRLERDTITKEDYDKACEFTWDIVHKYDDYIEEYGDWHTLLCEAIQYYLED